jgi:hypothetical protein
MIKIRLKLLDFNNPGSFTKAPKPNIDGEGENMMISDTITPFGLNYKQKSFNSNRTSSSFKIELLNYIMFFALCPMLFE